MNLMRPALFSAETIKDRFDLTVNSALDVYHAYQYNQNPNGKNQKYAKFSSLNYEEANGKLHNQIVDMCYEVSGLKKELYNTQAAFSFDTFEKAYFSVIETIIARTTAKSNIEQLMGQVAEVRSMAMGDSMNIDIKSKLPYMLRKISRGKNGAYLDRRFGQNVVLAPTKRAGAIGFSIDQITAGRVDYGREIALLTEGVKTTILKEVAAIVFSDSNPIGNKLILNSYTEATFRKKIQDTKSFNGVNSVIITGTDLALSTIRPNTTEFLRELGEEYMANGYFTNIFGNTAMALPQAIDDEYGDIIDNTKALIIPVGVDRPIKIGMCGAPKVVKTSSMDTADKMEVYNLEIELDVQLASDAHYGIVKGL